MVAKERVCVTGAGGYQASWLVKLLLSKGYIVHGTVRDPTDQRNAHLKNLDNASENLQLFKAELLDYDALHVAVEGCSSVFHVASPVLIDHGTNPEVTVVEPAVKGTLNVLKACSATKATKVVVMSSFGAVAWNPRWSKDTIMDRGVATLKIYGYTLSVLVCPCYEKILATPLIMDESCWSDKEFCKKVENWYCLSKTEAESRALEYGKINGLNVVTLCPTFIAGRMLQSKTNASSMLIIRIIKDGMETLDSRFRTYVDVRDVAEALLLVYKKPEAEGRYICSSHTVPVRDLVDKLKTMYPSYYYPKEITELEHYPTTSSEKLKKLGWTYKPFEQTLVDSVKDYQNKGILSPA